MIENTSGKEPPVVIISTADFNAPVWTNKQYIAVGLLRERDVVYVESMGLRRPALTLSDARRIFRRLIPNRTIRPKVGNDRGPLTSNAQVEPRIVRPTTIPFHGNWAIRLINHLLVKMLLERRLPSRYVLWTFSPMTYGLERRASRVIYHSVDLLHEIDRVPKVALLSAESAIIRKADAVIASSLGVSEHLESLGATPVLWENVADVEAIQARVSNGGRLPIAVFAGHFTASKIDYGLLSGLADSGVALQLAGPVSMDASDETLFGQLIKHPNVTYAGLLSRQELPSFLQRARVGIIPYRVTSHTAGVYPMKVYEYLAAGLDVVSTPLPSLINSPTTRHVSFASDNSSFASMVRSRLMDFDDEQASLRQAAARGRSWSVRQQQARDLVDELDSASGE